MEYQDISLSKKSLFWDAAKIDPRKNEKFIYDKI
jgi:hypothetical protein